MLADRKAALGTSWSTYHPELGGQKVPAVRGHLLNLGERSTEFLLVLEGFWSGELGESGLEVELAAPRFEQGDLGLLEFANVEDGAGNGGTLSVGGQVKG